MYYVLPAHRRQVDSHVRETGNCMAQYMLPLLMLSQVFKYTSLYPHKASVISETAFVPKRIIDWPVERAGGGGIHYQHLDGPFSKFFLRPQYEKLSKRRTSLNLEATRVTRSLLPTHAYG